MTRAPLAPGQRVRFRSRAHYLTQESLRHKVGIVLKYLPAERWVDERTKRPRREGARVEVAFPQGPFPVRVYEARHLEPVPDDEAVTNLDPPARAPLRGVKVGDWVRVRNPPNFRTPYVQKRFHGLLGRVERRHQHARGSDIILTLHVLLGEELHEVKCTSAQLERAEEPPADILVPFLLGRLRG